MPFAFTFYQCIFEVYVTDVGMRAFVNAALRRLNIELQGNY